MSQTINPRLIIAGIFTGLLVIILLLLREPMAQVASRMSSVTRSQPEVTEVISTDKASRLTQLGIAHQGGVPVVAIEESQINMGIISAMWSTKAQELDLHGKNITAVILEDDPEFQLFAKAALEHIGVHVIGIYPSCEMLQAARTVATIYVVDNNMQGAMKIPECAGVIFTINPLAIVLPNSTHAPYDTFRGKTIRGWFEDAGFKDTHIGGAAKDLFSKGLVESLADIATTLGW